MKKRDKTTLLVSNSWDINDEPGSCSICGKKISLEWGDYLFRLSASGRKNDSSPICKVCAIKIQKEKNVKIIPESFFQNQIQLRTSLWRKKKPDKNGKTGKE